jgi:hypothetical protein
MMNRMRSQPSVASHEEGCDSHRWNVADRYNIAGFV